MGLGAVHTQEQGGTWRVVSYTCTSRSLTEWRCIQSNGERGLGFGLDLRVIQHLSIQRKL